MPPSNSTALALAGRLRATDDAALADLLRSREIRDVGIRDYFDLADRLLDRASVTAAFAKLDRQSLLLLRDGAAQNSTRVAALRDLALVTEDAVPYDAVTDALRAWPGVGSLDEAAPAALEAVSQVDARFTDHAAAERAFATTFAVLEVVSELGRAPARELAKGGVALPDSKRLSGAAEVPLDALPAVLAVAASAGLATLDGGTWAPAAAASRWQQQSTVDRWMSLATAWLDGLPDDIRALLSERRHAMWGEHLADYVRWLYPASDDIMRVRMEAQGSRAELLGITANNAPSTAGALLLAGRPAKAAAAMAPLFPAEVDKVYLQHDLTIVSPGPLKAELDTQLRGLAEVESRGLATTYRVSTQSLNRAIAMGATAASLTAFLSGISITGIPQPLAYLIDETARRHALVRVGRTDGGSYVRSEDLGIVDAIRVDSSLQSIGLRSVGTGRLESRLDEAIVFWALTDARYPVAAEDPSGTVITLERQFPAPRRVETRDHAREIVERLRLSAGLDTGTGAAWLERQLELAIKARVAVTVTVQLPTGAQMEYTLEPTGLGGGRLRARDRKADIERTLPLTSIVEVRAAD